jgi:excinuclease ABC subunit A
LCLNCKGRGFVSHLTEELIIQNENWNLVEITKAGSAVFADQLRFVEQLPNFYDFDGNLPYKDLPDEIKKIFLYGSGKKLPFEWESKTFTGILEREFEGIIPHVERALKESKSSYRRNKVKNFMTIMKCDECDGYRINEQAREIKINRRHIGELAMKPVDELNKFLSELTEDHVKTNQGKSIIEAIMKGIQNMIDVGLSYIHINRTLPSLSGGELQRLSLMTHLDAGIDSLIYVLDEPSMSLHEREKESLIKIIKRLKELGNTIIVVEHDKRFIEIADIVIDIGPGAGKNGGRIVYKGEFEGIKNVNESFTGLFMQGLIKLPQKTIKNPIDKTTKFIMLKNATTNNLKDINVKIPLEMMVGIAGVSGSGKSSLILDTLVPLLKNIFSKDSNYGNKNENGDDIDENGDEVSEYHAKLEGAQNLDDVIVVNQKPISRVKTSTPCSYVGIWDKIRSVYAKTSDAKKKKYSAGHFSYNSEKGRCPSCRGTGEQDLQISFLSSFNIPCKECHGTRYKQEILDVHYKGKNIADILNMTVTEALEHFKSHPNITKILQILDEIGMGYITLGQPAPTLSGGEAQRVKLAKELGKRQKKRSLYVLDEPTVGLSFYDAVKLIELLQKIVNEGNSVIIIEHDPEILFYTDFIIELGPEGGPKGGEVIASGTPQEIQANPNSNTGPYLK